MQTICIKRPIYIQGDVEDAAVAAGREDAELSRVHENAVEVGGKGDGRQQLPRGELPHLQGGVAVIVYLGAHSMVGHIIVCLGAWRAHSMIGQGVCQERNA